MAYHLEYDANGKLLISGIECACGCAHTLPSQDIYVGANLIARINANAYSDVQGALLSTNGGRDTWEHVVYTVDPQGIKVYLNGELVGEETKDLADCFRKNKTGISQAKDVMVGSGAIWGDEDVRSAQFDDVKVYFGALTATEVKELYEDCY